MTGIINHIRFPSRSLREQIESIDGENYLFGLKLYPNTLKIVRNAVKIDYEYVGGNTVACHYPYLNAQTSLVNIDWEG